MNKIKNYELTEREIQVFKCILEGLSNREIAEKLCISYDTAKAHVSAILYKMKANNRLDIFKKLFDKNIKEYIAGMNIKE